MSKLIQITAANVFDNYGRRLAVGSLQTLDDEVLADSLISQGKAVIYSTQSTGGASPATGQNMRTLTRTQLVAAIASYSLPVGQTILVEGIPYTCPASNVAVPEDAGTNTGPDEDVVILGASAEMRSNQVWPILGGTITAVNGVLTFETSQDLTTFMRKGRKVRISANNWPNIEGFGRIISIGAGTVGATRISMEFKHPITGNARPDIATNTISGSEIYVCDTQTWSCASGWVGQLTLAMEGRIRPIILASGGTTVSDWIQQDRMDQIAALGRVGAIVIAGAIGNSLNSQGRDGTTLIGEYEKLVAHCRKFARVVYCMLPPNPSVMSAIGFNDSRFAASTIFATFMQALPRKYPNVRLLPTPFIEVQNYGGTTTTDVQNAYTPVEWKADDGIHNQWGGCTAWAIGAAQMMQQDFPYRVITAQAMPVSRQRCTVSDPAGNYTPNILEPFYGAVAQAGGVPSNCSTSVAGVAGWTITPAVNVNPDGGSDWIVTAKSNANVATVSTQLSMLYTGTGNSLLTQVNSAANQGKDIDVYVPFGIFGFTEATMSYVEVVLELDNGDGKGYVAEAGMSAQGSFEAGSMAYAGANIGGRNKGVINFGIDGVLRFPRFTLQKDNYVGARIRITARPGTGEDVGTLNMRMGADISAYVLPVNPNP